MGSRRLGRIFRLAAEINMRSRLKFLLLTTLISIGVLVFLSVTELSRASSMELTDAIEGDLGATGTYRIEPSADLTLPAQELLDMLRPVAARFSDQPLRAARRLPPVHPECPPYDQIGHVAVVVLLGQDGRPMPFDPGATPGDVADLCLAGMVVPQASLREATPYETNSFGASLILDPAYERVVQLTSTQRSAVTIMLTTGRADDQLDAITSATKSALEDSAGRASVPQQTAVVVTRADTGASVRAASDGIALVYGLIGWGVLLISGLGVLVAELIVLRDRTWYFGLARAVGARKGDVAWLVLADIVLVLIAGFTFALLIATVTEPAVETFGRAAFQTDLRPIQPAALARLALGSLLILLLAGVYPAWRATRLDPLDVLERR